METTTSSSDDLLEREVELHQLQALLRRATTAGGGRFVAVVGPAGIGKTRFLQAVQAIAAQQDFTCLTGRGGELEEEFPYGVVRQLFEATLRTRGPAERRALLEGAAELAAGVLGFDDSTRTADSPFAVIHGLSWLCTGLAERGPLLVVVDDLHWADESSLRFLAYLMRRVEDLPVVVLTAARPPLDDVRARLVETILTDPAVLRVDLTALSRSAVHDLVRPMWDEMPTDTFVDALTQATHGNPFLCLTVATALSEQGVRPDDEAARRLTEGAGGNVADTIRRRLDWLPDAAGDLARAVAVVGGSTTELRHVAALTGLDLDEAGRARDLLGAQGLLAAGQGLEFEHPLVRTAIYDGIPRSARSRIHHQAARLLAEEAAPPEQVALHLLATEPQAEPWVIESLLGAARTVLRQGEPSAAVAYLQRALREPPRPNERAAILHELGVAQFRAGDVDEASRTLADALRMETDPRLRLRTGRELGFALFQTGRFAEAVDVQGAALDEARRIETDAAAWLEAERHQSALMDPRCYRRLGDSLGLDTELLGDTGGDRAVLAARSTEGALRVGSGATQVAAWASRAVDRGLLEDSMSSSSGIWVNAAIPLIFAGHFSAARSASHVMVDDARRRGAPVAGSRAHMVRALANLRAGAVVDAEADARWSCELGAEVGFPPSRLAVGVLVEALVERGELDTADAFLREVGCDADLPNRFVDNWILYSRGRLRGAQGRVDEATEDLVELARRGDEHWRRWNPGIFSYRSVLALVFRQLDDRRRATELADEELRLAETWGAPFAIGIATRTLGLVVGGDHGLALLAASVETLDTSGARLEYARSLIDHGSAIRRIGRLTDAREPLGKGAELAEICGASALVERALDELRATGARPRRIARSGVNALTSSELRVARLAADGMSNREIAQALFVTVRTVEVHLTHCYQKLGISSRNELSTALGG